ncbi:MAG: S26 family signal peptidase [Anaerolineae bacterium]|nr:S26 family signal peptidase [Anaerolineae bacterium]
MNKFSGFSIILLLLAMTACGASNSLDGLYLILGASMEPTFPPDTILGIDQQAYSTSLPQRGDIILFDPP